MKIRLIAGLLGIFALSSVFAGGQSEEGSEEKRSFQIHTVADVFYIMSPVHKFEVDSDSYYGYRPGREEFFAATAIKGGYFQYQLDPPETLVSSSYRHINNNTALDNRVKTLMRNNNLTCCETYNANDSGGFTYVVHYSFDNYKTFGTVSMDSTGYE
jgi:hypothetical protein